MGYKYISTPHSINYNECCANKYVFAPSKYMRFSPQNDVEFVTLASVCTESVLRIDYDKKTRYQYTEIGDIDISSGHINSNCYYGIDLPSDNPKQCKQGDILISTVRTYRGGIGMVTDNYENHCCSPAILVIREVSSRITKEYLLAVLKSDFFIEQVFGLQTRGMYPRLDSDAMEKILIPIPQNIEIQKYISVLQKSCLKKQQQIILRHSKIIQLIEKELLENQLPNAFIYNLPRINKIIEVGRLDTGLYSIDFLKQKHAITNYKYGYCDFLSLNKKNVKISRGQNLQESSIGKSIYSNNYISGYYTLCLSKNFTINQTITKYQYLGNNLPLKTIKEGEIIFSCRGEMGRMLLFCEPVNKMITNIDSVHISFSDQELYKTIFIAQLLSYLKEIGFIKKIAITGSGADSFTKYQFEMLLIPNFPDEKQREISRLYHNPRQYNSSSFTIDNFLQKDDEYNQSVGIYELDKTAKRLKEKIDNAIDSIIKDEEVELIF